MKLDEYRRKRDFAQTPEPSGPARDSSTAGPDAGPGHPDVEMRRFVVQEHHARRLHWDFRLEVDGVLRSWAVPKGPPTEPGTKRLAVATEDHPLEYLDFEGTIPQGNYGAGTVTIWDQGYYAVAMETPDKLLLALHGRVLSGAYYLIRTKDDEWLMWKSE